MSNYTKDLKKLATEFGFAMELSKGGHYKLTHPEVKRIIFASNTPGDCRVLDNVRSLIRRSLREAGI